MLCIITGNNLNDKRIAAEAFSASYRPAKHSETLHPSALLQNPSGPAIKTHSAEDSASRKPLISLSTTRAFPSRHKPTVISLRLSMGAAVLQGLSNICWAYAKLGWTDPELMDGVALALQKHASTMALRDITEILWSYSAPSHTRTGLYCEFRESQGGKLAVLAQQTVLESCHLLMSCEKCDRSDCVSCSCQN